MCELFNVCLNKYLHKIICVHKKEVLLLSIIVIILVRCALNNYYNSVVYAKEFFHHQRFFFNFHSFLFCSYVFGEQILHNIEKKHNSKCINDPFSNRFYSCIFTDEIFD